MAHKARKRFGQNFLEDHHIIYNILAHVEARADEHWVEIGPGMGALTEPLLKEGVNLDVVELDRDLVVFLQKKFKESANIRIHSADALAFDFASLASEDKKIRIIGNLPYNISTPLMFHLLETVKNIEDMHFMLQKEVVDRVCASEGSRKYGKLSVMMAYFCDTEHLFDVPPESFNPIPKVMSAIVRLRPHSKPPVEVNNFKNFNYLVTQAFSQRRKTIRNSLKKLLDAAEIEALGIKPTLRAEMLSLEEFAQLSNQWGKKLV